MQVPGLVVDPRAPGALSSERDARVSLPPSLGEPVSLVAELQRRRVCRALVGYGIAAFAILQIIEPIMHGLVVVLAVSGSFGCS